MAGVAGNPLACRRHSEPRAAISRSARRRSRQQSRAADFSNPAARPHDPFFSRPAATRPCLRSATATRRCRSHHHQEAAAAGAVDAGVTQISIRIHAPQGPSLFLSKARTSLVSAQEEVTVERENAAAAAAAAAAAEEERLMYLAFVQQAAAARTRASNRAPAAGPLRR